MSELEPLSKRIPTPKHRKFIDKYFELNLNATKAYQAVYGCTYESALANGPRLLGNDRIREEIDRRLDELTMPANEAIVRLGLIARGDIGDFVSIRSGNDLAEHSQSSIGKRFKKKVYFTKDGELDYEEIDLELYSADAALRDILKVHGKFSDNLILKLEGELDKVLDQLEQSLDPETFQKVLKAIANE